MATVCLPALSRRGERGWEAQSVAVLRCGPPRFSEQAARLGELGWACGGTSAAGRACGVLAPSLRPHPPSCEHLPSGAPRCRLNTPTLEHGSSGLEFGWSHLWGGPRWGSQRHQGPAEQRGVRARGVPWSWLDRVGPTDWKGLDVSREPAESRSGRAGKRTAVWRLVAR